MHMLAATDQPTVLAHHPVGASTGYMSDLRDDWPAQVEEAMKLSRFAVELSVLSEPEVDGLLGYLRERPSLPFRYISIHGPSKARKMSDERLVDLLAVLGARADAIVMHPDTIEDAAPYCRLGRKLVLENMDLSKRDGRTASELAGWFGALPAAGFCFDVAHAWSVDSSLAVASEMLDRFGARLRHLHISSLDEDLRHVPLREEHQVLFAPLLGRCRDVPWILEAPPGLP